MLTLDDWKTIDRRMIAIHEAAHVVVAAVKGVDCHAHLEEGETDNATENTTFTGRMQSLQELGDAAAAIGIAGALAVFLDDCDDADLFCELFRDREELGLSTTDLESVDSVASDGATLNSVVAEVQAILTEYSWFHDVVVDALVETSYVTNGQVRDTLYGGPASLLRQAPISD
jgi:hypothetical protein